MGERGTLFINEINLFIIRRVRAAPAMHGSSNIYHFFFPFRPLNPQLSCPRIARGNGRCRLQRGRKKLSADARQPSPGIYFRLSGAARNRGCARISRPYRVTLPPDEGG